MSYIYVGKPVQRIRATYGEEPRVQLNDAFASVDDIQEFVAQEREARSEQEAKQLINSIKADTDVKMGIITDIKQELRKAQEKNSLSFACFEVVERRFQCHATS